MSLRHPVVVHERVTHEHVMPHIHATCHSPVTVTNCSVLQKTASAVIVPTSRVSARAPRNSTCSSHQFYGCASVCMCVCVCVRVCVHMCMGAWVGWCVRGCVNNRGYTNARRKAFLRLLALKPFNKGRIPKIPQKSRTPKKTNGGCCPAPWVDLIYNRSIDLDGTVARARQLTPETMPCVCVCVCVCARALVCVCVCLCACVCVCVLWVSKDRISWLTDT